MGCFSSSFSPFYDSPQDDEFKKFQDESIDRTTLTNTVSVIFNFQYLFGRIVYIKIFCFR